MTADEFEAQYAERSGVSVEWLRAHGRIVVPCECGDEICEGWASVNRESWEEERAFRLDLNWHALYDHAAAALLLQAKEIERLTEALKGSEYNEGCLIAEVQEQQKEIARLHEAYEAVRREGLREHY